MVSTPSTLTTLSTRILETVAYCDQFDYPLTAKEIWLRLLMSTSYNQFLAEVAELQAAGFVTNYRGYLALGTSTAAAQKKVASRLSRQKEAIRYQESITVLVRVLRWVPWIRAVAVTGSLSMGVARSNDDVDIMLVAQPHRLWLTRLLMVMVSTVLGRRRYWWEDQDWFAKSEVSESGSEKHTPKWCLNVWLTTECLAVPVAKRSVYTAYEVLQARFVYLRQSQNVEKAFLLANSWVRKVAPQFWLSRLRQSRTELAGVQQNQDTLILAVLGWFRDLFFFWLTPLLYFANTLVYWLQVWYMRSHMTREHVSMNMAYFHPRPTNALVVLGWKESLINEISHAISQNISAKQSTFGGQVLDETVLNKVYEFQKQEKSIVLVTGIFDLLHRAHRQFLLNAKAAGEVLVVGVESDVRVRALKGDGRPVHTAVVRQAQLEQLGIADMVFVLPEQFSTPEFRQKVLAILQPSVLAVSAHSPHIEAKKTAMARVGGRVEVVMEHDPTISTTILLDRMK